MPKKHNNDTLSHIAEKNVEGIELEYKKVLYYKDGGFIKLLDCLVNYPDLTLMDRLVYSAVNNYSQSNDNKRTNISNGTIADRLGISPTTVSASISHLQELGILHLYKARGKNQRIIEVVRDFNDVQQEQKDYEAKRSGKSDEYEIDEGMPYNEYDEVDVEPPKSSSWDDDFPF